MAQQKESKEPDSQSAQWQSPEDIGVLTGMEETAKLDAVSVEKGFFAKLVTSGTTRFSPAFQPHKR
jgi:hypothetical protein